MSLMLPTRQAREGTHTVCPIWPQQILHVEKQQYMLLLVLGPRAACLRPSVHVRMSQNPRLAQASPFLGVMPNALWYKPD